jgi:THO complex subunit 4
MIKSKPRQRKGGRGGSRSASAGAPASGGAGAGGARQRYASNTPTGNKQVNAKINQAAQKPLGGDATKVIISNLPMDVTEAAVRVCLFS